MKTFNDYIPSGDNFEEVLSFFSLIDRELSADGAVLVARLILSREANRTMEGPSSAIDHNASRHLSILDESVSVSQ